MVSNLYTSKIKEDLYIYTRVYQIWVVQKTELFTLLVQKHFEANSLLQNIEPCLEFKILKRGQVLKGVVEGDENTISNHINN